MTSKNVVDQATVIVTDERLKQARTAWLKLSESPRSKACKAAYAALRKAEADYESALFVAHCR